MTAQPDARPSRVGVPLGSGPADSARSKTLGAYYTDPTVAEFLVRWAVATPNDTVLDPGFGGGAFLQAAIARIQDLGGDPRGQVFGIEFDELPFLAFAAKPMARTPVSLLRRADFFSVAPGDLPPFDAVVGNPPFIRYQRFSGEAREAALRCTRAAGVELSGLTSSWAPFLVHATRFLKPGGRLAMVGPAELAHAAYARPVLEHLARTFRSIQILSFGRRLFPELSQDTVLVLADGQGGRCRTFTFTDLPGAFSLPGDIEPLSQVPGGELVNTEAVVQGHERLLHYLLPQRTRQLYRELASSQATRRLGEVADVGVGYVTGDNDFFHLNLRTVEGYGIPDVYSRPAARSGADLTGLHFTRADWDMLHARGHANLLLHLPDSQPLPDPVRAYLRTGETQGVPNRYKCRVRWPWYRVPHVYEADAFLTYMSGATPKLVANLAGAVAPNTLHVLRLYRLPVVPCLDAISLAALWQTSLTLLSGEMEGHSLGGGMLKLEPTEAGRVLVATPERTQRELHALARELDQLLRAGKAEVACALADAVVLRDGLGLGEAEIEQLREGCGLLRSRRMSR